MNILKRILNSFIFWGAWIIIPVLMEILPEAMLEIIIGSVCALLSDMISLAHI